MLKVEQKRRIERAAITSFVLLVIVGLVIAWLSLNVFKQPPQRITSHPAVAPGPQLPDGWSLYTNKTEGFSIWYPFNDAPDESNAALASLEPGSSSQAFDVSFERPDSSTQQTDAAPVEVRVSSQTLAQAIKGRLALAADDGPTVAIQSQITNRQSLTIDGHPAVRFDQKDVDTSSTPNRQPDSFTTYVYIGDGTRVYLLETTSQKQGAFNDDDTQTMLQSFTITASK